MIIQKLKDLLSLLDGFVGDYPVYMYLIDTNNTVIWFNQFMAQSLPEIQIGQNLDCANVLSHCEQICPECQDGSVDKIIKQAQNMPLKTKIGSGATEKYLEFFNFPVSEKDGQAQAILRIGMDVTKNEKLQETLREKEKLFTAIIDSSTDAVIFLDNEDRIMSWNRGAEDIFGYSPEEITRRSIHQLVPEELIQMGELDYIRKQLSAHGFLKKFETRRVHKEGRIIYVDITASQVYDEQNNCIGTSQIIKDIDSRKELEFELLRTILELSKLNELNEILHSTYEEREILNIILIAITAGEGLRFNRAFILMVDKETQKLKGHLAIGPSDEEEANRIWSELNQDYHFLKDIIKIYRIDMEGADKKVNEIVHQIETPLDDENHILIQSLNKRRVFQVLDRQITNCNENYHFNIFDTDLFDVLKNDTFVIAPIFSKKEPLGLIIADNCINRRQISNEDVEGLKLFANQASSAIENARLYETLEDRIQDLQNTYQQLEENQEKLLRSERLAAIGEMSAKVTHEIRNPLVSIGGFAGLIERKIQKEPKIKQYAGIIREQVINLENILDNILSIAKPPKPEKELVNINQIIRQLIQVMENALEQRNIRLIEDLEAFDTYIIGDNKLLYQALLNMIKNAIEALDGRSDGGEILIQSKSIENNIEIKIADNGVGIETNLLNKIFQTFYTTKSSGTGLGLTIVNQIIDSHQGKIDVQSKSNEGTTFCLRFPAAPTQVTLEKE